LELLSLELLNFGLPALSQLLLFFSVLNTQGRDQMTANRTPGLT
jgi:hypothetical protein